MRWDDSSRPAPVSPAPPPSFVVRAGAVSGAGIDAQSAKFLKIQGIIATYLS